MKVVIQNDYEKMCEWAANHIIEAINNHKEDRPFVLGLPTGSSPIGVYKRLVAANKAGKVIAAAWLGKIKTTTQMICILVIFLEPVILPFKPFCEWHILSFVTMAAMTVMTLWSGIDYLVKYWEYIGTAK